MNRRPAPANPDFNSRPVAAAVAVAVAAVAAAAAFAAVAAAAVLEDDDDALEDDDDAASFPAGAGAVLAARNPAMREPRPWSDATRSRLGVLGLFEPFLVGVDGAAAAARGDFFMVGCFVAFAACLLGEDATLTCAAGSGGARGGVRGDTADAAAVETIAAPAADTNTGGETIS